MWSLQNEENLKHVTRFFQSPWLAVLMISSIAVSTSSLLSIASLSLSVLSLGNIDLKVDIRAKKSSWLRLVEFWLDDCREYWELCDADQELAGLEDKELQEMCLYDFTMYDQIMSTQTSKFQTLKKSYHIWIQKTIFPTS